MPVIHTHVSVSTTPEQREALKAAYGKAITAVPGKSEGWLMCPFEDNMPIYFGGSDDQPAAYVEVNVFGRSVPGSAWEKLTESIMAALNSTLGIPEDRTYIRYCLCSISCCGFSHDDFSGLGRACRPRNGLNWMVLVSPPERTGKDYDQHAPSTVYPSFAAERGIRRVDRAENTCQRADGA